MFLLTVLPRGLIPRGPELDMVAFTVVERGEMTSRFISVRSALVWARVRAAGGLEDTTSFFPPFSPTTRLPDPVEDMANEKDSEQAVRNTELPDDATERTLVSSPFRR